MNKQIKTRFGPSPTGFLHVGSLRTALFAYLWAKKNNGSFLLRIEDTDQSREVDGAMQHIQDTLEKFGLLWDEGPEHQSKRLDIYKEHVQKLIEQGSAYEDDGAIRQKIPAGTTEYNDLVYGKIRIENRKLDEGVLLKSDGFPTYNFANVVDDHLMGISHVMRGEEFIPSTPKHILLYEAFGWEPPEFAHLPLILGPDKKKLSKRTGDVAVQKYLEKGYLKEAILNFIALLGWNPKTTDEIFSLEELIQNFEIKKINKASPIFDTDKLDFINREWQKKLKLGREDPLYKRTVGLLANQFENIDEDLLLIVWPLILERIKGPSDLEEKLSEFYFFFEEQTYDAEILPWKKADKEQTMSALKEAKELIDELGFPKSADDIEKAFMQKIGDGDKGTMLWPLRVALSGQKNSPGPFEIISVFSRLNNGKEEIKKRIDTAIDKLG